MKELIVYPNCSKGGVTTVIRGRAAADPELALDAMFFEDRGGSNAFDDLPNVRASIIRKDRAKSALQYMAKTQHYDAVSVLSAPAFVEALAGLVPLLRYEFHSSDLSVIKSEIAQINFAQVDEILAPTEYMANQISNLLPHIHRGKMRVEPNLVDERTFSIDGDADFYFPGSQSEVPGGIPLVWVGRFDNGKGYRYFIRLLASLPKEYFGVVVVSLEKDPARASAFLNECAVMGVSDRVQLFLNLAQGDLSALYRYARDRNGYAISTSLLESFGYSVAEATACGLRVAAFQLPVWREHPRQSLITTVPTGSVQDLASAVLS